MSDVFHLNLTKSQLKGATLAIVPGDPASSERIAKQLDNPEFILMGNLLLYALLVLVGRQPQVVWKNWLNLAFALSYGLVQQGQFNHILMWVMFLLQRLLFA